jgi:hypothetical protein
LLLDFSVLLGRNEFRFARMANLRQLSDPCPAIASGANRAHLAVIVVTILVLFAFKIAVIAP